MKGTRKRGILEGRSEEKVLKFRKRSRKRQNVKEEEERGKSTELEFLKNLWGLGTE
jgi:hypothetical protein